MSEQESFQEEIAYLEELLNEYTHFVNNIGNNGFSENLVMHYRDEIQETLTVLEGRIPLETYWKKAVDADQTLRENALALVTAIGWDNYQVERGIRKPLKTEWWWYLDLGLSKPEKPGIVQSLWNWIAKP